MWLSDFHGEFLVLSVFFSFLKWLFYHSMDIATLYVSKGKLLISKPDY